MDGTVLMADTEGNLQDLLDKLVKENQKKEITIFKNLLLSAREIGQNPKYGLGKLKYNTYNGKVFLLFKTLRHL